MVIQAYRRPKELLRGVYRSDITLVNWPQNDFWLQDLVTATLVSE